MPPVRGNRFLVGGVSKDVDLGNFIQTPGIVPAPEVWRQLDPRGGKTMGWMGADVAFSMPLDANRIVWWFGDTHWALNGFDVLPKLNRINGHFTNDSWAIQTGLDPATATFTFHSHVSRLNQLDLPAGTHYCWAQSAMMVGNDMYVFSMRVQKSDWTVHAGWAVHKITNANLVNPVFWNAVLVYESANTEWRPVHSPYEAADGYIYAFTLRQGFGWTMARWLKTAFVAGNLGTVEYLNAFGWGTDPSSSDQIAYSPSAGEGSVHRRAADGRWIMVDSGGTYPLMKTQIKTSVKHSDGNYYPWLKYYPLEPHFRVGDQVDSANDFALNGTITKVLSPTSREIVLDPAWDAALTPRVRDVSTLTMRVGQAGRVVYDHPENYKPGVPGIATYASRAHPHQTGKGLLITYADNADWLTAQSQVIPGGVGYDVSTYWPKAVWVLPPRIDAFTVNAAGLATWRLWGIYDRLFVRVNGGAEIEVPAHTTSYQAAAGNTVTLRVLGIGGQASST